MDTQTDTFLLNIQCGKHMKQVLLPELLDGVFSIKLDAFETGHPQSLVLTLLAENGFWFLLESKCRIKTAPNSETAKLIPGRYELIDSQFDIPVTIQVIPFENLQVCATQYTLPPEKVFFYRASRHSGLTITDHENSNQRLLGILEGSVFEAYEAAFFRNGTLLPERQSVTLEVFDTLWVQDTAITYLNPYLSVCNTVTAKLDCTLPKFMPGLNRPTQHLGNMPQQEPAEFFQPTPRVFHRLITTPVSIDAPPQKREPKYNPLLLTMGASGVMLVVMLLSVWLRMQSSTSNSQIMMVTSVLMIAASAVGTVLMPLLLRRFQERRDAQYEHKRQQKYTEYIDDIDLHIWEKHSYNREVYGEYHREFQRVYDISIFAEASIQNNPELWNKHKEFPDFLDVRIGKGIRQTDIPITVEAERFMLEDDPLRGYAQNICHKYMYIRDVPVSVSFKDNYITGIIGNPVINLDFVQGLILRLCTDYSYKNVLLGFIYERSDAQRWRHLKWLPHTWFEERKCRLIATTPDETEDLFKYLKDIRESRRIETSDNPVFFTHYVVFVLSRTLIEGSRLGMRMLEEDGGCGISFVILDESFNMLPPKTNVVIQNTSVESSIYSNSDISNKMHMFTRDSLSDIQPKNGTPFSMEEVAQSLFRIRIRDLTDATSIPEKLTFLEMYHVSEIRQLNVEKRWRTNRSLDKIETAVGLTSGGKIFHLDIRENKHGPHGLMGGTTGSGKSEFLQSFLLSLAINYSPQEIAFVLVDYKGGGMANQFQNLPHLAGIITNLEENEIRRSLNTLISESTRRQYLFKKYEVNNIDRYHEKLARGEAKEPLPHLLLVVDEFAELRRDQPEFMAAVISLARTGRSLGIHLILATQNPKNAVSEDIWANSRFRICLRVAEPGDSREILKRTDAASIRQPGRAYVQVGNDEVFVQLQSGYSGAHYCEAGEFVEEEQKYISLLRIDGQPLITAKIKESFEQDAPTQLTAIVAYLQTLAEGNDYTKSSLWLPPLPNRVMLKDLGTDSGRLLSPKLGMMDDPRNQKQPVFEHSFLADGHLAVYGLPGSGKSTFIQTLITSLARQYTPAQVQLYLLDWAAHNMGYFKRLPHVGDVVFEEEESKLRKLRDMLTEEIVRRKRLFQSRSVANYKSYLQLPDAELPAIVLVVQDFGSFRDTLLNYTDFINNLAGNGTIYGLYLVLTAKGVGTLSSKLSSMITQNLTFRLKEKSDYFTVLSRTDTVIPASLPGRGLLMWQKQVLEFQTALAADIDADSIALLSDEYDLLRENWSGDPAPQIPVLPNPYLLSEQFKTYAFRKAREQCLFPLGYDAEAIEPVYLPDAHLRPFVVLGAPQIGKTNFALNLVKTARQFDWACFAFSHPISPFTNLARAAGCDCGDTSERYSQLLKAMASLADRQKGEILRVKQEGSPEEYAAFCRDMPPAAVVIDDFEEFLHIITDNDLNSLESFLKSLREARICLFITLCTDRLEPGAKSHRIYSALFKRSHGLLLGGRYDQYSDLFRDYTLTRTTQTAVYPTGTGLLLINNTARLIVTPESV